MYCLIVLEVRILKQVSGGRIKVSARLCYFLEALTENLVSSLFQLQGAACISWLVAPFHLQS